MEKEGLVRAMKWMEDNSIPVGTIVTDRHRQIGKYIRENLPGIKHYYDIWHVAKGKKSLLFSCNCDLLTFLLDLTDFSACKIL